MLFRSQGEGTEQAGTGTDAGQVPDRKDRADQMVKPKNYNEAADPDADASDADAEGDEAEVGVDVDKAVKEIAGDGAGPIPAMAAKAKGDDLEGSEAEDVYEQTFEIFKEAIEKDAVEVEDDDDDEEEEKD